MLVTLHACVRGESLNESWSFQLKHLLSERSVDKWFSYAQHDKMMQEERNARNGHAHETHRNSQVVHIPRNENKSGMCSGCTNEGLWEEGRPERDAEGLLKI